MTELRIRLRIARHREEMRGVSMQGTGDGVRGLISDVGSVADPAEETESIDPARSNRVMGDVVVGRTDRGTQGFPGGW